MATIRYATLGTDCKLYLGDSETEATNVKDVTWTLSTDEADITTRYDEGWKATQATLRSAECSFQILQIANDKTYLTLKDAFEGSGSSRFVKVSGSDCPKAGYYCVTGFTKNEPLSEAVTYDVTLKYAGATVTD